MKKSALLLASLVCSTASHAALYTLPDGLTPTSTLQIDFQGTQLAENVYSSEASLLASMQFQLNALDRTTDEKDGNDFLTVQFGYYAFTDTGLESLGFDPEGYSFSWSVIEQAQLTALETDELTFSSNVFNVINAPVQTRYSSLDGQADYLVAAYIESDFANPIYGFIDFEVPPPPVSDVTSPASAGMVILSLLGLAARRRHGV